MAATPATECHDRPARARASRAVLWLAAGVLIAGCNELTSSATQGSATAPEWRVDIAVDGGFAGLAEQFTVDAGRAILTASDSRRSLEAQRRLTQAELQELGALLDAHPTIARADARNSRCADCIRYAVAIRGHANASSASYDSSTLPRASDAALIMRIVELGRQSLAEQTDRQGTSR